MPLDSVNDILDFAIEKEQEAVDLYNDLATKVTRPGMSGVFREFANEEKEHKERLLAIKREGRLARAVPAAGAVMDLKLSDYLVDVRPRPDMDYQEALILAMKREKASFRLYINLAAKANDPALRSTFLALAQEEAKHKLRFEIEYDECVLTDN